MRGALLILLLASPAVAAPVWQYQQTELAAVLHYGEGDASTLGIFCSPGAGMAGLHAELPGAEPAAELSLTMAGVRYSYPASALQNGLQAMISADDPLWRALAGQGRLLLAAGGVEVELPLPGAEAGSLQRACAGS